jgi:hypothetical protein
MRRLGRPWPETNRPGGWSPRRKALNKRRHLNAGQTAILLARAYPERRQGKKTSSKLEEVSAAHLSYARLIEDYAPELGDQVLARQITFEEARRSNRGDGQRTVRGARRAAMRDDSGDEGLDLSMTEVNQRLSQFIAEHKAALARGEQGPFAESDKLLAAWAADALEYQAQTERLRGEALAKIERMEFDRRGGRLQ